MSETPPIAAPNQSKANQLASLVLGDTARGEGKFSAASGVVAQFFNPINGTPVKFQERQLACW